MAETGKLIEELEVLSENLGKLHIAVLGDVMVDHYIVGQATRISPEAPVPVIQCSRTYDMPGGASNVASNLKAMGCRVSLFGLTGDDAMAATLGELLHHSHCDFLYLMADPGRPTTVKTRVLADGYQVTRIDWESAEKADKSIQNKVLHQLEAHFQNDRPEVLILQDYDKGFLHAAWIGKILGLCRQYGIRVAVDPKERSFFAYRGVDLFKPNLREATLQYPGKYLSPDDLPALDAYLRSRIGCNTLMVTLAAGGIWLGDLQTPGRVFATESRKVADVSGAGDTVISLAAICMARSLSLEFMAMCCNEAGGQVCEKAGVVAVDRSMLLQKLESMLRK
ncbi:MAG: carbohydrate kinase [Saprospiraceae bacterium]|jgi:rfaE bifunctional protein kinase chain/domain|nr:carbohydrate kinase [Saprospiraceae bacterium]MBP9210053.1 carbohydrate kinase [Saprospiraceae bacterium]MBV6472900.1 Bifunctional protein HldE [Saprospiraceae bacterium]